jgi:hypothetical protein
MIWIYRFVCIVSLTVFIPMLSRKRWNKWFNRSSKSHACTVHVGGLSREETRHNAHTRTHTQKHCCFTANLVRKRSPACLSEYRVCAHVCV